MNVGTYIENFVSSSEGFFLLLGPNPHKELDLMKIWQKEAFVDIIVVLVCYRCNFNVRKYIVCVWCTRACLRNTKTNNLFYSGLVR
jgi:hypothetical protein